MDELTAELDDHIKVMQRIREDAELIGKIEAAAELCVKCLQSGGKLLFCGNGGSAADSQHLATELTVRFTRDRRALAAIALTTDGSALTAIGNDFGFDRLFARQVEALAQPNDALLCFSTSGNSRNVIQAVEEAGRRQTKTIFFGGKKGGALKEMVDIALVVPSEVTARIQEAHITLGHMVCGLIERRLGLV
ncbi:D-sedoheptulose 7-phosphate isomerase [Skermanella mucosa]|uniref:D-sedoheptulose-7-phosphate isomerase n=1 Tax=Skermanella mucosa TaxID=1789672 RepID=UPI00192AFBE5|nr:D-sedoheptulose 7-phosphate isomerase [Skermanella mucosa]UEM18686.1 D-sedoheptulose 7-phosphate isomerase [Skermanella mucosa]